ncbi:hypothetical protein NNO07_15060 [Pseudomonas resinovorans]|uniref:Uncharacterized protein n=1 Tax=Metapseudomonas resinovorans TaxID=53412 RepID=A0ABT4Y6I8_METRE|nr:hypothetical protein [Pseudomonas resinovorans]MDA8484393.1 hypothetical protein [Pseudomonas resinovorans]
MHVDADPARGIPGTVVTSALMNTLQDELAHAVEALLGPLDKADNYQLLKAIRAAVQTSLVDGDYVTHPELGNAAYKNVGAGADQVAVGNHGHPDLATKQELSDHVMAPDPHSQYERKTALGQAAYRNVGMAAGLVAPGDHTHAEFGQAARAYYADVYAYGATSAEQARDLAASALPIKTGDTLLVRWQEVYVYGTGNGTASAARAVVTYWLYQAGWVVISERR